ncbi:MAG: NTP transferase domain-containing protein [Hyphomonadaceae bacterium]
MSVAAIVEALWTDTPGMALAPLGESFVLERAVARAARIEGLRALVCLLPDTSDADEAARRVEARGAAVVRADAADPLAAFAHAALLTGAETVLRLRGDRPYVDPGLCARVAALLGEADADYACTDLPATWPHGLDCEAFPVRLLHWADSLAAHPAERACVTGWLRANPDLKTASLTGPGGEFARMRWVIEWPEDMAFAQALEAAFGARAAAASAAEIASLCLRRPDLAALNAGRGDMIRLRAGSRATVTTPPLTFSVVA